jgi:DNA excision repair protein ERCC-6-like 2
MSHLRRETIEDIVNRIDEPDSDDDLDIGNAVRKDFVDLDSYVDELAATIHEDLDNSITEGDEGDLTPPKPLPDGEQLRWDSEDDGDGFLSVKKTLKRKRQSKSQPGPKLKTAKRESGTAKPGRPAKSRKGEYAKLWKDPNDDPPESDNDMPDEYVPSYINERKSKFEEAHERLQSAGLKLPPVYDDIDFSDDEDSLQQKPKFPKLAPIAPDEDIELEYSAGVIPAPIAKRLRGYQVKGAAFMHEHFVYQRGGILGDDMGTGKTIQTIAFLTAAFGKTGDQRDKKRMHKIRRQTDRWYPAVLIVCPGTLMSNWREELNTWGFWHIYVLHGAERDATLSAAKAGRAEIVLTTYKTYQIHEGMINTIAWDCVIADEFHQIKERRSEISKAMNRVNALCRIGLSGTAIQNSYDELWTLLNWTNPGQFGDFGTWRHGISNPLRIGQAHDASVTELARARRIADKLANNLLPRFFLRRTKALIAHQLPKKSDRVVFCPLTDTQADAYQNFIDSDIVEDVREASKLCDCGSQKKRGWCCHKMIRGLSWQTWVFPCIATLQKLCNHLALIIPSGNDPKEKQEKDLDLLRISVPDEWQKLYRNSDSMRLYSNHQFCGKWAILSKLLRFWYEAGDKVLVFSHSVKLLRMLKILFTTTDYSYSYLDGSMSYEERSAEVDHFNSSPDQFVFLISSRAGGVGLNITSANKVVVVDPHWNPSFDLQAQDRAYRIGQTRDVEVFRMISVGTIEEIVYARQIYKQQMANIGYNASLERRYFKGVQDQKDKKGEIFGLENMFAYQGEQVVLREIVNKTNIAESKANVLVTEIDISDDEEDAESLFQSAEKDSKSEDPALSQLADIITGKAEKGRSKRRKPADGTEWILAQAGVEYSHDNAQVIGTSKIESKLSRQAMERGNDIHANDERAFVHKAMLRVPKARNARLSSGDDEGNSNATPVDSDEDEWVDFSYRPPEDVRKRQFCSMAKHFGFANPTDFAVIVEGWTQAERRNCLDTFYRARRKEVVLPLLRRESNLKET